MTENQQDQCVQKSDGYFTRRAHINALKINSLAPHGAGFGDVVKSKRQFKRSVRRGFIKKIAQN